MLHFPFIAEAAPSPVPTEGMPAWLVAILYVSGGGLFTGVFTYLKERIGDNRKAIDAQSDRAAASKKEGDSAQAGVETARVQAKADLDSKYFAALENERAQRSVEIANLRSEFESTKRTLGHEIRNLRNALYLTQEVYHQLWTAYTMVVMQVRILRSRVKKAEGDLFDESEFPPVDIEVFDPRKLFPRLSPEGAMDGDPRKLTGRITITPDKP